MSLMASRKEIRQYNDILRGNPAQHLQEQRRGGSPWGKEAVYRGVYVSVNFTVCDLLRVVGK